MATYQNELMHIYASRHFTYAINAKELHDFLFPLEQNETHFQDWLTDRIRHYGFEWNLDFVLLAAENAEQEEALAFDSTQLAQDVSLSLNMAKELARIERTERGRDARYYLLECEFQLGDRFSKQDNHESFDKKVKQLNQLAQSIKVGNDVAIIPTVDLINLIKAIREYQNLAYLYATPNATPDPTPEKSEKSKLDPEWVDEVIQNVKQHTGKSLLDERL
ncbi:hypothetical protein CBF23_002950 [Marinomonas agarivorans]|nr:hypothetical protein CBF23_002950 [Marinomonas agarivorans]